MKIRNLILAASAAALLSPAAFATTTASKTADCTTLQQKFDKEAAANANAAGLTKARETAAEGEKLCKEGKSAEGSKKLHAAMKELNGKAKY
jgi:anti-sigma factor RsiW